MQRHKAIHRDKLNRPHKFEHIGIHSIKTNNVNKIPKWWKKLQTRALLWFRVTNLKFRVPVENRYGGVGFETKELPPERDVIFM